MIKKLRLKFIYVNMLFVTLMLVLSLGILITYMQKNLIRDQYSMLERIAADPSRKLHFDAKEETRFYSPCFVLENGDDGKLRVYGDSSFDLTNEEELQTLYDRIIASDTKKGIVPDYNLRYVRMVTPLGTAKLVFTDMSGERATMWYLTRVVLLMGFACLAIFFVISLLLSRWAVKPVDEAWRQQKQFVSDASHELKTPLTVIMANAELLQQPGYSEEQRRGFSDSILSMSRQMSQLVESLLNLARLDSLRETDSLVAEMDLSSLVEESILPFEPVYFERGLLLESDVEPGIRVHGNERVLRQCMDILLDNAQKYSEPGTVKVCLRRSGRQAELTVTNPAPEMSRAECRNIFKRFYRLDAARTSSGSYGLGLSIAEGIVERHGGKITCDWDSGEICFTVTIPTI